MWPWQVGISRNTRCASLQIDEEYVQRSRREMELMTERHKKELEMLELELDANMRELTALQVSNSLQVHTSVHLHVCIPYTQM